MEKDVMKRSILLTLVALALMREFEVRTQEPPRAVAPVTDATLRRPDPGDWLSWRRTLDGWGYSPLDQINRANVARLRMVWTRALGPGQQEGTPLVHDGVMYVPATGDDILAVDAKDGDVLWEYQRKLPDGVQPKRSRAIAIWGRTIINASSDNFIYALDARTGALAWETPVLDPKKRAPTTGGPIVANGKVITGRQCQPDAGHESCVMPAHDVRTGHELWRTRTIPRPGEPGDESWGGVPMEERWHIGTWMVPSYDPELNLIYIGTSVTIPAPKFTLGGNDRQHLFHNCTLALNADTGRIVWYYQHIVDHWDLDHPFERLLVDTTVAPNPQDVPWINPRIRPGERRKVITGIPGKTGLVYTLDRQTGEFLWARPTVTQNVVAGIDGATGRVRTNPESLFSAVGDQRFVCPTVNGGKNFQAGAYSPLTNTMYYALQNACAMVTAIENTPTTFYAIQNNNQIAPGTDKIGTVQAISVEIGKTVWKYEQRAGYMSLVATGGGLIFGGDTNGHFRAFDQNSGMVLWEINLGSPATGYPITYAVGGKQYVAVSTGNSLVSTGLNRLAPELHPSTASNIFVFALP